MDTTPLNILRDCSVHLISKPLFMEPDHMKVNFMGDASDGERLAEFAGRLCYMSQNNPANRATSEYLTNIMGQRHFSVTEHANYSILAEGISRSLTHEYVRHRHLSPSQLSQRYVDSSDTAFVLPPAFIGNAALEGAFEADMGYALRAYDRYSDLLMQQYSDITNTTERRKKAREAARCVLPNSTETKIVMTGNVRAWRHFLTLRANAGADQEIQRLARKIHAILVAEAPSFFGDYQDSSIGLVPTFSEV